MGEIFQFQLFISFIIPSFCPKPNVGTGLYDTLQFPFSNLAGKKGEDLVNLCKEKNVIYICMKVLSGGLITRSDAAYAYLSQFDNTLPIWEIQRESELDEFISYIENPPVMTAEIKEFVENERKELVGEFCHGCGYCMPCPVGIEINNCARMSLLLRRFPTERHLSEEGQAKMKKIEDCMECDKCKAHCPYGLDTTNLLKRD